MDIGKSGDIVAPGAFLRRGMEKKGTFSPDWGPFSSSVEENQDVYAVKLPRPMRGSVLWEKKRRSTYDGDYRG